LSLFVSMLALGLLTSFHCVMMCGNLVLTYAIKGNEQGSAFDRMKPHFAYHGAKILSYTLVGAVLGALGVFISPAARSWVSLIAGGYMVLMGLGMTPWFPWLRKLSPRPPKFFMQLLMKMRKKAAADAAEGESSLLMPIGFGLITGLMPCGPLQAAQLKAAAAGNPALGALAMLAFGLGTMPLMLGYGAVASYLNNKLKHVMPLIAAGFIVVLGFVMVNRGAMALGSPVTFATIKASVLGGPKVASVDESQYKKGTDGVIEVPLAVKGGSGGYDPSALSIPSDKPVRLLVTRTDANACSDQLAIPQIGVLVNLVPNGTTKVDLPATKSGSYTITCGMGMLSGRLVVGNGAATATAPSPIPLMLLVGGGLLGWTYWGQRRRSRAPEPAPVMAKGGKGSASRPGSSRSAGARGSSGTRGGVPQPAANTVIFGFTQAEVIVTLGVVGAAIVAGLAFGGLLR